MILADLICHIIDLHFVLGNGLRIVRFTGYPAHLHRVLCAECTIFPARSYLSGYHNLLENPIISLDTIIYHIIQAAGVDLNR